MCKYTPFDQFTSILGAVIFSLCFAVFANAQTRDTADPSIPAELTPTDPDIRELLHLGSNSCKASNSGAWAEQLQKSLQMAESRGLVGDRAVLEAYAANASMGDLSSAQAFVLLRKALQDSMDAKREILEADVLVSLSVEEQMKGNNQQAVDLIMQALALAMKTGNLYGKARALGELARLDLLLGKTDDASKVVDEALTIDKLNALKFEALHLFYKGLLLGLAGKENEALETLVEARTKALIKKDTHAFLSAEKGYAFALAQTGKASEAIRQLDVIRAGNLGEFSSDVKSTECVAYGLQLPVFRVSFLEGFGSVLDTLNQKEKEIEVWQELYSISQEHGFIEGQAEAKQKLGDLENGLKRTDEAVKDYAEAATLYKKLQNNAAFFQVVFAQSLLMLNSGRGIEAIPLVEEVANYAKQHGLREIEFSSYIMQASIYQKSGDAGRQRDALEKAITRVRPGPFDEKIDNRAVHSAYVSLSDIYRAAATPTKELISIDSAFFVSVHLNDDKSQKAEVQYLTQRLKDLGIRQLVEQRQKEGKLAESLIYSCVLYVYDGPNIDAAANPNLQRILTIPFQLAQTAAGAEELTEILIQLGPMLGVERLALVDALARYYATGGSDALRAENYANQALSIVEGIKGDPPALKAEPTCILALSYSQQGKRADSEEKSAQCLELAAKTQDEQTIIRAEAATAMAYAQIGNIGAAKGSLEGLIKKAPNNPDLFVELARSLASAKLYNQANSQLEVAIKNLLLAGNKKAAARAYVSIGLALGADSSETAKKLLIGYLESGLKLYKEIGDQTDEAATLVAMGDYFLGMAEYNRAVEHYLRAQDVAQQAMQQNTIAWALLGLGNVYEAQGDFTKAQDFHTKASALFHAVNNAGGETIALRNLGRDSYELGEADRAQSELLDARRTANKAGSLNQYFADYSLGLFYQSQGQFGKALTSFKDGVKITSEGQDTEHCAYSHLAIASLDTVVGRWEEAITESQLALGLFQKIGDKAGQSYCWAELTGIYSDRSSSLKNFDKAQECYKKALEMGSGKDLQGDLMEIDIQTGKYSEAAHIAAEHIKDCRKERNTDCLAHGLISLAEADGLGGHLKESRAVLNEARPLALKSADLYLRARYMYADSRVLKLEGRLDDSLASYERLVAQIESVKGKLDAQQQRSLSENYTYIYDELVSLLYTMSRETPASRDRFASEALEYSEKNKARQFADSWGEVFTNQMRQTLPASIQEHELVLYSKRDRLIANIDAVSESEDPNKATSLQAELTSVQSQIQVFLTELRKVSPQYAAIAYPEEIQIASIPLKQGETLVEFKMTEDSTFVWIVQGRNGSNTYLAAFYEIPRKRSWFLERFTSIRNALNAAQPDAIDWKISEELFALLFPPEAKKIIDASQEIIFIPDDVLFVLPFELLSPNASKGDFILLKKATTYYPSAVSLRLARTAAHSARWQKAFLGIADPITSPEDERFEVAQALKSPEKYPGAQAAGRQDNEQQPSNDTEKLKSRGFSFDRLPGTAVEVQSIVKLLKERQQATEVRLGVNATKNELLDTDLSSFRFLHFATHGVLPVDTGIQEPSLVLSYDGVAPDHMFLSLSEILKLKLQSESVVLSACNTGSGKISKAEGVMSLGRAFLAAGSSSVTVSLWQVSDESTALLMENYYRNLLNGERKSIALAEARYAVFAGGSKSPYFWAPFIIIGE